LRTQEDIAEAVSAFASRAAAKLRRQGVATAHLSVFLQTNPFRKPDAQYMPTRGVILAVATADTGKLITAASQSSARSGETAIRQRIAG
jgi:DNA polymerase V